MQSTCTDDLFRWSCGGPGRQIYKKTQSGLHGIRKVIGGHFMDFHFKWGECLVSLITTVGGCFFSYHQQDLASDDGGGESNTDYWWYWRIGGGEIPVASAILALLWWWNTCCLGNTSVTVVQWCMFLSQPTTGSRCWSHLIWSIVGGKGCEVWITMILPPLPS